MKIEPKIKIKYLFGKTHVIKKTREGGEELPKFAYETWCGEPVPVCDVSFTDATHALLTLESGSIWGQPRCEKCLSAIRDVIDDYIKKRE